MSSKSFLQTGITGLLAVVLLACSAGGGETGTGETESVTTVGVITGFGSVFINGVEYETSNQTSVSVDGVSSLEDALKVGMVVSLTGQVNPDGTTGNALAIEFEDNVEGEVLETTYASDRKLNVMGQIVVTDIDTVFESNITTVKDLNGIVAGHILEVSGYTNGDGVIYATRIELKKAAKDASDDIRVKGIVSNLTSDSFTLGNLSVTYTNSVMDNFEGVALANGQFVEVESAQNVNNGVVVATKIELKTLNKLTAITGEGLSRLVELEGVITQSIAGNTFYLNAQQINVDASTRFEGGDLAGLIAGSKAEVKGYIQDDNSVLATKIELKRTSTTEIKGLISSINSDARTIVVSGQTIRLDATTRVKDERDDVSEYEKRYFNFSNLTVNDFVELSVYFDDSLSMFIATKLERDEKEDSDINDSENDNKWELEGIISSIDNEEHTVVVTGIEVDVSGLINFIVQSGDNVKLEGIIVDGKWIAQDFDLKSESDSDSNGDSDLDGSDQSGKSADD